MAKKGKCKKDPTERVTKSDHCTIPHIKEALQSYNNILDTSILNTNEMNALQQINEFWNTEQVYDYEDTLDIDKFYDIKKFHEVLNGKHDCNSTANIDLNHKSLHMESGRIVHRKSSRRGKGRRQAL